VRGALIEAAGERFAARGPAAVTVREIAEVAGVNHGLVHHYFGSKEGLLTAVLDALAAEVADEIAATPDLTVTYATGGAIERHGRILAFLMLDSRDPADVKTDFPAMDALIARLRTEGVPLRAARERAAQVVALVFGWQLFQPFLTRAAGLDVSDRSRGRLLEGAVRRVLSAGESASVIARR
jgi:AcrR family transcriptional regulator